MEKQQKVAVQLAGFIGESVDLMHKDRDWLTRQDRTNEIIHTTTALLNKHINSRGPKFWVALKVAATTVVHVVKEARKEIK